MWRRPTGARCSSASCATCWPYHAAPRPVPPLAHRRADRFTAGARSHGPSAPRASRPCWVSCRSPCPRPSVSDSPAPIPRRSRPRAAWRCSWAACRACWTPASMPPPSGFSTRIGWEVVVCGEEPCCGSLTHHMGKEEDALARARRSIDQWIKADVDAVIVTASGCGTTIKDYGHMLRLDPAYAEKAKTVSAMAKDITEFLLEQDLPEAQGRPEARLSFRLLHAAWPEAQDRAAEAAAPRRLHRHGRARRPSLLRLGRHLQHPPAGDRDQAP